MDVTLSRYLGRGDDASGGVASVGRPTWGPAAWLADLELRLGLPTAEHDASARTVSLLDHARSCARSPAAPFYARSLAVDATATAAALLSMRDALVEASWDGRAVGGGGPRLEALAELEAMGGPLPGMGDRLRWVREALGRERHRPCDRLRLLEPPELWPGSWRALFERIAELGTRVEPFEPAWIGADRATDLGRAQAAVRDGAVSSGADVQVDGDGSLLLLRGATSWEIGEALAALLRARCGTTAARDALVLRLGDPAPLDAALVAQGLGSQGLTTATTLRPAPQVLPLALALLFLPRDVQRALELLSLPVSPIPAAARFALLDALGEAAGVGSSAFRKAVQTLDESARERVAAWLEPPGFGRQEGAPRDSVLAAVERVRAWAAARRATSERPDEGWGALLGALGALRAAVQADDRARFTPHELDLLVASSAVASVAERAVEAPGRPGHLSSAHGLLRPRRVVAVWHAGLDTAAIPVDPFRVAEHRALAASGVHLPSTAGLLEARARANRRALFAATELCVIATPDTHLGSAQPQLPLWDEISAGLALDETRAARLTVTSEGLCRGASPGATGGRSVASQLAPLLLPAPGAQWALSRGAADVAADATKRLSASALESLLGCSLRFVLDRAAHLRSASVAALSDGALLKGKLGHRLVEELFHAGLFATPDRLAQEAPAVLDGLVAEEGAPLHQTGRSPERAQVCATLLRSVTALAELLAESALTIEGVEVGVEHEGREGVLHGRVDLLLRGVDGQTVVLDLKLGGRRYGDLLARGEAFQLAHYTDVARRARALARFPDAAYFSLGAAVAYAPTGTPLRGPVRTVEGPPLEQTARAMRKATTEIRRRLRMGEVLATGIGAEPMALGVALGLNDGTLPSGAACTYCSHAAICGLAWEGRP